MTGYLNAATGASALQSNTTAYNNTATGHASLFTNTTGFDQTATGHQALYSNTTGYYNTANGMNALYHNTTGHNNIAVGLNAGINLNVGNNNIDIGNAGVAAESNTVRIGTQGTQTATYIARIAGVGVAGGADVVVNSGGKLGVVLSSARYKHDIRDMGSASSRLLKLRPVTFRYKDAPTDSVQHGLVAEEVAKVYPELVVYGPDGGTRLAMKRSIPLGFE